MSYFQHMIFAMTTAFHLSLAVIALIVHAFVPCWFENTGSEIVKKVHRKMVGNGKNSSEI